MQTRLLAPWLLAAALARTLPSLAQLTPETAEKVAYRNAVRVYGLKEPSP
jgi:predicted TIM-barrel fold metal-dependent hydrolase